jgi:hypothetical protein
MLKQLVYLPPVGHQSDYIVTNSAICLTIYQYYRQFRSNQVYDTVPNLLFFMNESF